MLVGMFEFVPAAWDLIRGETDPPVSSGQAKSAHGLTPIEVVELEKFRLGIVLEIRPSELLVQGPGKGELRFLLSAATRIWDDSWVKGIPLEVGDSVLARGDPRSELVFEVTQLFVNMVDVLGAVTADQAVRGSSVVDLYDQEGEKYVVRLDDRTMMLPAPDEGLPFGTLVPLVGRVAQLSNGQPVWVIGRRTADGSVLAVTLEAIACLENE